MREVTLEELQQIAENAREDVWSMARYAGREPKLYLHWTAGHYGQFYNDYHICIDKDGSYHLTTEDLADVLAHTEGRNSGGIGIALCCCAPPADTNDLGPEPPTSDQIDAMAKAVAALCDALWLTINKEHVMTHGEAADNEDGYDAGEMYGPKNGCERWDLEYLGTSESPTYNPWADDGTRGGDVIRGKAIWFRQKWRAKAMDALAN